MAITITDISFVPRVEHVAPTSYDHNKRTYMNTGIPAFSWAIKPVNIHDANNILGVNARINTFGIRFE